MSAFGHFPGHSKCGSHEPPLIDLHYVGLRLNRFKGTSALPTYAWRLGMKRHGLEQGHQLGPGPRRPSQPKVVSLSAQLKRTVFAALGSNVASSPSTKPDAIHRALLEIHTYPHFVGKDRAVYFPAVSLKPTPVGLLTILLVTLLVIVHSLYTMTPSFQTNLNIKLATCKMRRLIFT